VRLSGEILPSGRIAARLGIEIRFSFCEGLRQQTSGILEAALSVAAAHAGPPGIFHGA